MKYINDLDIKALENAADETNDLSVVFNEQSLKEMPRKFETPQLRDKEKGSKKNTSLNINASQFKRLADKQENESSFQTFSHSESDSSEEVKGESPNIVIGNMDIDDSSSKLIPVFDDTADKRDDEEIILDFEIKKSAPKYQKRILIVDDQSFNIEALFIILKYSVGLDSQSLCDKSFNGQEALQKVVDNVELNEGKFCNYDLIFMDCNMPFMDGYEATFKIREYLYNQNLPQPIISAITGHTEQAYIDKSILCGMN